MTEPATDSAAPTKKASKTRGVRRFQTIATEEDSICPGSGTPPALWQMMLKTSPGGMVTLPKATPDNMTMKLTHTAIVILVFIFI